MGTLLITAENELSMRSSSLHVTVSKKPIGQVLDMTVQRMFHMFDSGDICG